MNMTSSRPAPARWHYCLSLFALLVAGCSSLKPIELPPEYTPPPAHTEIWDSVSKAAGGNWHGLLNDGPGALDWRLRAIDSASDSIDFQTFLWHFDTAGSMVMDHIIRAADRGVTVRILVDDTFLVHEDELLLALAEHPNIEYRVFNPFTRRSGGQATRQLLNLAEFSRLDHRMHNKAMLVDNQVAIVGGRNIADEYFGLDDAANFRDLELLLGGTIVQEVGIAFDSYWNDRWSFPIERISHKRASAEQLAEARRVTDSSLHLHTEETTEELIARWLEFVEDADTGEAILYADDPPEDSPKNREEAPIQVANELVSLFDGAESEIVIVSAYLIPTPNLEGAVERALDRGVRVRILTNSIGSNNHLTAHSAYRNHINTLLEHGAELHEVRTDARDRERYMLTPVQRKMLALHAKALIIDDDKVFIGSANLDPRSLRINTEMGFLVLSDQFNQELRAALEGDFSAANAWRLELQEDGKVFWVSNDQALESQPATSFMQRIEDWFFSHMPIEGEL
ncbi:MAG: phospholipase D family protein [Gammaproteobacteria bacterium]|nr:phospholipase D family protein [Gammaproteobacteria bacterium]